MGTQQFCLKWNNHHSNMLSVFEQLLSNEALVDVTLACEGVSIKAHKVVLSACSPFFQTLFVDNPCKHPIVIMKDMRYVDLKAIIDFIYHGEVNVSQDQLSALLKTAETLKVKGLAEVGGEKQGDKGGSQEVVQQPINNTSSLPSSNQHRAETPPIHKRKRGRPRRRSGSSHNSDVEDQVPSKIKQPDSPEIISDISRDGVGDVPQEVSQRLSVTQSRVPPISSSQSVHSSHKSSHSMYSSVPSQQDSGATIEEPAVSDANFDLEPSRLMEQSMTAGSSVSMYEPPALPSSSPALALPSSSAVREAQSSNSLVSSQAIIPTSLHSASDSSASGLGTQDTLEDIKPFVSFEEPPVTASVQSHDNSNAMIPYMDTSGVAAIPGPSSYQPDMSLTQSQVSQQPSQGMKNRWEPLKQVCTSSAEETNFHLEAFVSSLDTLLRFSQDISGGVHRIEGHIPEGCTRRRCVLCSKGHIQRRSNVKCGRCDVALCMDLKRNCFAEFHKINFHL
ncbi:protein tramtrack, beta isoform-like isoform X3 [Limulus polyphemus]|uniref:Protein tramtrack, beta isoform-like isoform X3 n=1 Tax=Limulus polyphemus TaxID=6850 RepID=A0ABM1BGB6_LIMPO|nr:protein tramtrack, beta isoform-like isoform X3 [Limulus polyphemus]